MSRSDGPPRAARRPSAGAPLASAAPGGPGGTARPAHTRSLAHWFWGGFVAVLLAGLVLALFAGIRGSRDWISGQVARSELPPAWRHAVRVTLAGGESLYLEASALAEVQAEARQRVEARRAEVERELQRIVDDGVRDAFAPAYARVPDFAGWYYSLAGEYTRLLRAALGEIEPYLEERVDELLFGPAGTAAAVDALAARVQQAAGAFLGETLTAVQGLLLAQLRELALPPPSIPGVQITHEWAAPELGSSLWHYLSLTTGDIARQGAATSGGVVTGAAVGKKLGGLVVTKASAKLAGKTAPATLAGVAAKLGLKSAAKAGASTGAAATGAATGAGLCAATVAGVALAPGCAMLGGALAGAAAWLLVDTAVIEADEYLHRDALEGALRGAIAEEEAALKALLAREYLAATATVFDRVLSELGRGGPPTPAEPPRDFVPARATTGGSP